MPSAGTARSSSAPASARSPRRSPGSAMPAERAAPRRAATAARSSTLYGRVFANPKAPWLIGGVAVEGTFFYGLFPYMGELLLTTTAAPAGGSIAAVTGLVLGAFGIGGLLYAASVRADAAPLRRAPHVPDRLEPGRRVLRRARRSCRPGGWRRWRCSSPASASTCCTTRCRPRRPSSRRRRAARRWRCSPAASSSARGSARSSSAPLLHGLGPRAGAARGRARRSSSSAAIVVARVIVTRRVVA